MSDETIPPINVPLSPSERAQQFFNELDALIGKHGKDGCPPNILYTVILRYAAKVSLDSGHSEAEFRDQAGHNYRQVPLMRKAPH